MRRPVSIENRGGKVVVKRVIEVERELTPDEMDAAIARLQERKQRHEEAIADIDDQISKLQAARGVVNKGKSR